MRMNKKTGTVFFIFSLTASFFAQTLLSDQHPEENVNGFLPEHIYIKTLTQTSCKYADFVLVDGRIYWRKTGDNNWSLYTGTGLPHPSLFKEKFDIPERIVEISADNDVLYVFDDKGKMYVSYLVKLASEDPYKWKFLAGFPKNDFVQQNELVLNKRTWSMAARRSEVHWYEDASGNQHHYGTMGIETVYFLTEDGRTIRFTDSGLPQDFSRSIETPSNGTFIAENLSASGETVFLIGNHGTMYTRLIDFDTMGCDPMFIEYTYNWYKLKRNGNDYWSNYSAWALPAEDWRLQPSIPLNGNAKLSKLITIYQTGKGNESRELRVAGLNAEGSTGYYWKNIFDEQWNFTEADILIADDQWLEENESENAECSNLSYSGFVSKNGIKLPEYKVSVSGASLCSEDEVTLTLSKDDESFSCKLYAVEKWTFVKHYNPGYDGTPRQYFFTAEFDESCFENYSSDFRIFLTELLGGKNHKLFGISGEAGTEYFQIDVAGPDRYHVLDPIPYNDRYVLFAGIDGDVDGINEFLYKGKSTYWNYFMENTELFDNCYILPDGVEYSIQQRSYVEKIIADNIILREELNKIMKETESSRSDAENKLWLYNCFNVFAHVTLISNINFPKIKQMISFGDQLVGSNAERFISINEYASWFYPAVINLLNLRIETYSKIIEDFNTGKIVSKLDAPEINSYEEIFLAAGFPLKLSGSEGSLICCGGEISPLYILTLNDGTKILVCLKDAAEKMNSIKGCSSVYLKKHPVSFDVDYKIVDVPENWNHVFDNMDDVIGYIDNYDGQLIWNGENAVLYIKDAVLTKTKLFDGTACITSDSELDAVKAIQEN